MGYTIPLRNRPNGYPGLSPDGDLVGNLIVRTGAAVQLAAGQQGRGGDAIYEERLLFLI